MSKDQLSHTEKATSVLSQYWGYTSFRTPQSEIIQSVVEGKDTLALLPTGGGKSLCFQVPAMMMEGITIVISPLIALMEDQVQNLKKRGINAVSIHSGLKKREVDIILDNCIYGDIKLLYVAPERLESDLFLARASKMNIAILAIDEAHCISQWGYDFRPHYLKIDAFRKHIGKMPCIALTATASGKVVDDIKEKLNFKNPEVFKKSFKRENLSVQIYRTFNKVKALKEVVKKHQAQTGLIYVRNRRMAVQLSKELSKFTSVDYYHAGLKHKERSAKQKKWINGEIKLIVATNAFGMGIDKDDVRYVFHFDLPPSLEEYYQEIGRAGRGGKESTVYLFYNEIDLKKLLDNHIKAYPTIEFIKDIYDKVFRFFSIPVGEGKEVLRDFNFYKFYQQYDLDRIQSYNAVVQLEKEGYLTLSSGFKSKNSIRVTASRDRVLNSLGNEKVILQYLLRNFEGISVDYVKIDETRISRELDISKDALVKNLLHYDKIGLLDYQSNSDQPKLFFHHERLPKSNLLINTKLYKSRKERERERIDAMQNLLIANDCRQTLVLEYFDEDERTKCGKCDYCLSARYDEHFTEREVEKQIELVLNKANRTAMDTLFNEFEHYQRPRVLEVLKRMEENEGLIVSKDHYLSLVQ